MKKAQSTAASARHEAEESPLFAYFREDHALLGNGFHELATCLRRKDVEGARAVARRLDRDGGSHIAFEENALYPALAPGLGTKHVERMLNEHDVGFDVIRSLTRPGVGPLSEARRLQLLEQAETMLDHIAECGELFYAVGQLSGAEQGDLCEKLLQWRELKPSWISQHASDP